MTSFLGIDLAWQSERNPSGAVTLRWRSSGLEVAEVAPPLRGLQDVQRFVRAHRSDTTVVAVDAPLVIANVSGLRPCERAVGQRYGGRHASCHASNLTLYPDAGNVRLASWLSADGFSHARQTPSDLTMLEIYPHSAFVALFDLPSIIRYKKGLVAAKVQGLREVQRMLARLPLLSCAKLDGLLQSDPGSFRGRERKSFEDSLDSLFCAFLGFHFWRHRLAGSEIFGDDHTGYLVNPRLGSAALHAPAA